MNRQLPPELLERLKARSPESLPENEGCFDPQAMREAAETLGIRTETNPNWWNRLIITLDRHYPMWRGYAAPEYGNLEGVKNVRLAL